MNQTNLPTMTGPLLYSEPWHLDWLKLFRRPLLAQAFDGGNELFGRHWSAVATATEELVCIYLDGTATASTPSIFGRPIGDDFDDVRPFL